ncbi:c-type cytochrome [Thiomonas sp.]|uniref:Putative Cytochrome c, class IE n=1 Tax=mine drainage metagenome TaxID=410659 RepID=E6PKW8_9ZZZZ
MSEHPSQSSNESGELPFASTLRKTIIILLVGFATPVIVLLLIVHFISDETVPPAGSLSLSTAAVDQRVAAVGQVAVASSAKAASQANAASMSSAAPAPAASATATAAAASQPAGGAPAAAAVTVASADAGKTLYESSCIACHGAGIAGAPKFGDKDAWAPIIAQGVPVLYDRAIHGYTGKRGMMPPKGGSTASDADVKAAVDYMVAAAKS